MTAPFSLLYKVKPSVRWMVPLYTAEISDIILIMLKTVKNPSIIALLSSQKLLLEILFVSDAEIAEINKNALGCSGPTNILSFPATSSCLGEGAAKQPILAENILYEAGAPELGTLVLAPKTFLRECFLYGQSPKEHFIRLLAHGLVHLLGYDHGEQMDELCERMEQEAKTLSL